MKTRQLLIAICLMVGACAPLDEEAPDLTFAAVVHTHPEPNHYAVELKWNPGATSPQAFIERTGGKVAAPKTWDAPLSGRLYDDNAEPGAKYTYSLNEPHGTTHIVKSAVSATIPVDLDVKETSTLTRAIVNRLFLHQSPVTSRGENIVIEADTLFSDNAEMDVSPLASTRLPGGHGRACGNVLIHARKAVGRLHITCDGENGADGADGRNGKDGAPGAYGTPGDWGMNPDLYKVVAPGYVPAAEREMRERPKPPGDPEWTRMVHGVRRFICAKPPTNGGPGEPAGPGDDGGRGGNGGDTEKISITIVEQSDFAVTIDLHVGRPGLGGRGGNGGRGGYGGDPGALDQGHLCPSAQKGPPGKDGLNGRPGKDGEPGHKQLFCIRINNQTQGDCL